MQNESLKKKIEGLKLDSKGSPAINGYNEGINDVLAILDEAIEDIGKLKWRLKTEVHCEVCLDENDDIIIDEILAILGEKET